MSDRLITMDEVCRRVPFSRVHIYRLIKDGKFPRQVQVGEHRVAWREADVQGWIEAKVQASQT